MRNETPEKPNINQKVLRWINKYRFVILFLFIVVPLVMSVSFYRIMDKTVKKRRDRIEFLVVHYTANFNTGADARANATYLRNKESAGTHYCIDDKEIIQCTDEENVAYAVGDKKWRGFVPKPWLSNKIRNNNSLSFEMCLGGGRNDSLIIETTAQQLGWQLVNKGLDISRVVRHHDVTGKHCPKFFYTEKNWDQAKEDREFYLFKLKVLKYQKMHLDEKERRKAQEKNSQNYKVK
jgi:N-acetylmuramoyl-L-alanine amidase CwlA